MWSLVSSFCTDKPAPPLDNTGCGWVVGTDRYQLLTRIPPAGEDSRSLIIPPIAFSRFPFILECYMFWCSFWFLGR